MYRFLKKPSSFNQIFQLIIAKLKNMKKSYTYINQKIDKTKKKVINLYSLGWNNR